MKIKDMPTLERPREKFLNNSIDNLSDVELLSIILKTGTKKNSVKDISCNILNDIKDIRNLKNINYNDLIKYDGIGKVKAIELLTSLELGKRVYQEVNETDIINCTNPTNIIKYFNYLFKDKKQEEFYVILLDNKKNYIKKILLFKGTINMSVVHPREIFKEAYLSSSSYLICLHNHPTGDATPSNEDINLTNKIKEIGLIHSIPLIDHIIIGNNNYFSFYENNMI